MFYSLNSFSPYKVNQGALNGGGGGGFANTYSLLFDEVDTMVSMGDVLPMRDDGTDAYSVSLWFKTTSTQTYQQLIGKQNKGGNYEGWSFQIRYSSPTQSQFRGLLGTLSGNAYLNFQTSFSSLIRSGNWNHVVMTYDGSQVVSGFKVYLNNAPMSVSSIKNNTPADISNSTDFLIGQRGTSSNYDLAFDGNQDEVSYFDSVLSQANVTSIFNLGIPNDISSLNPLGWWRMGDSGTWNGTKWILTDEGSGGNDGNGLNMVEASRVNDVPPTFNVYSTTFDGIDDSVSMGNVLNMSDDGTDAYSFSLWFKTTRNGTQNLIGKSSPSANGYNLYISGSTFVFLLGTYSSNGILGNTNVGASAYDGTWKHVCLTYDGSQDISGFSLYYNGISQTLGSYSNNTPSGVDTTNDFMIGARGTSGSPSLPFDGNIDEASYFNSELSASDVTSIFNLGIPNDISAMSGLVSYWRMGDNDTYPTITDNVGSNNGTMNNMSSANFVTDVPT